MHYDAYKQQINKQNQRKLQTSEEIRFKSYWVQYRRTNMNTPVKRANSTALGKTLRKHAYSNIPKIWPPKNEKFQIKKFWYFSYFWSKHRLLVLIKTASTRRGGSNEYQQSIFNIQRKSQLVLEAYRISDSRPVSTLSALILITIWLWYFVFIPGLEHW